MSLETVFPLIISNTDLSLWSQCELRWYRERCQNLRKPSFNIDLVAGGSFAKGLELTRKAFYQDKKDSLTSIDIGYNEIITIMYKQMEEHQFEDDKLLKSPERMALALVEYFKQFPLDQEELIPALLEDNSNAIEHKITIELPILHPELQIPLIFKGKLDMLAIANGRTYGVDEKTCKAFSAGEADLLKAAGQFIGYAWLAKQKGITVQAFKVRKVAIQVREIKVAEFEIPITDFMVDMWERAMLFELRAMVDKYKIVMQPGADFMFNFIPDYQQGCISYFRPCPFVEGCVSKYGESFIESNFEQIVWDSEDRKEISLTDYKQLIGL